MIEVDQEDQAMHLTRRGRQARNFTTNVPKSLDLKSSSEQTFSENYLTLGAPDSSSSRWRMSNNMLVFRKYDFNKKNWSTEGALDHVNLKM